MDAASSELFQPDSAIYYFPGETDLLRNKKQIHHLEDKEKAEFLPPISIR